MGIDNAETVSSLPKDCSRLFQADLAMNDRLSKTCTWVWLDYDQGTYRSALAYVSRE